MWILELILVLMKLVIVLVKDIILLLWTQFVAGHIDISDIFKVNVVIHIIKLCILVGLRVELSHHVETFTKHLSLLSNDKVVLAL